MEGDEREVDGVDIAGERSHEEGGAGEPTSGVEVSAEGGEVLVSGGSGNDAENAVEGEMGADGEEVSAGAAPLALSGTSLPVSEVAQDAKEIRDVGDLWSDADVQVQAASTSEDRGAEWEAEAERVFQATKVVDEDGEPYGMFDFALSAYGSGISIYFAMLLYLALAYLIVGIIAVGMSVIASREPEPEVEGKEVWTVDSVGPGLWRWEDPKMGSGRPTDETFIWLNVVWTVVLFVALLILKRWTLVECHRIDEKWLTDGDYTIDIKGLPVTADGKPGFEVSELAEYVAEVPLLTSGERDCCTSGKVAPGESSPLSVYQIILIYNVTQVVQLADEHAADLEAERGAENRLSEAKAQGVEDVQDLENEVVAAKEETENSLAALLEESNKEPVFSGQAFVIFDKQDDSSRFSDLFRLDTILKLFFWLMPASEENDPEKFAFKGKKLLVEWAPEPNDIIWVNHSLPESTRQVRTALSWVLVTLPLVAISTLFQLWLDTIEGESSLVLIMKVVAIMFINGCIVVILIVTSGFERPQTFSVEGTSRAYKLFVAQFLNMTFPPMVLYYSSGKATRELANFAFFLLVGEGFRTILFEVAYTAVVFYGTRWWGRGHADTQEELIECYEGVYFDLGSQFTQILKVGLLALFYAPVCPSILLVASASFVVNHFADKFCLVRWCAPPPSYNAILPVLNLYMLFAGLAFHGLFSSLLFYGVGDLQRPASIVLLAAGSAYTYYSIFLFHVWPSRKTKGVISALGAVLRACLPGFACADSCGPHRESDDSEVPPPDPLYSSLVESLGQGRKRGPQVPPPTVMPVVPQSEKRQQKSNAMRDAIMSRVANLQRAALKKVLTQSTAGVIARKRRARMVNAVQWRCQATAGAQIEGYRWNNFIDCDEHILEGTKALAPGHTVTIGVDGTPKHVEP